MRIGAWCLLAAMTVLGGGCMGGDHLPPLKGQLLHEKCRATSRKYWLYLPEGLDANTHAARRRPLVVSLHGMKPYDTARSHAVMWARPADRHGYVVLAPELDSSDAFGQFPLREMGKAELGDVNHVLACIDEVSKDQPMDPDAVLLTSWSMGGYLAHYLAAEQGGRFAAFAALDSNFSAAVLDAAKAKRWADRLPVLIYRGTRGVAMVTGESKEAVGWYRRLGFKVEERAEAVGHERHPEQAADFFAKVLAAREERAGE